jgi:streptogramin lyase
MRRRWVVCLATIVVGFSPRARAVKITEYTIPTPSSGASRIALGPDGRLWFTEYNANQIGAMTPDGVFSEYVVPTANSHPVGIAAFTNSFLCYTEATTGKAGFIATYGTFAWEGAVGGPTDVVLGSDGQVWGTEYGPSKLFKLSLDYGVVCDMPLTVPAGPLGLVVGGDGYVWVTDYDGNKILRCSSPCNNTAPFCVEYPIPTFASHPNSIALDLDRTIWFTELSGNKIGKIPWVAGAVTEYTIPTADSSPTGITAGPDGNVWFTEGATNKIGRITPEGVITEFPLPTANSAPAGIVLGPGGALYFTEYVGNKIGKFQVFVPGDADGDGTVDVADVFFLINFLFAGGPAPK